MIDTAAGSAPSSADVKASLLEAIRKAIDTGLITSEEVAKAAKVRGRSVPPLPQFTFPDSGITVGIRKLGPFTIDKIRLSLAKEFKPPTPPIVRVNYGTEDEPDFREEPNPADPEYKEQLLQYEAEIDTAMGLRVVDKILTYSIDVEPIEEDVERMRQFLVDIGMDEAEVAGMSAKEVYIKHVCIVSTRDISEVQALVTGMSIPSEVAVQMHADTFQRSVQGQASVQVSGTSIGTEVQPITGLGAGDPVVGGIY